MQSIETLRKIKNIKSTRPILSIYLGYAGKRIPHVSYFVSQLHSVVSSSLTPEEKNEWKESIDRMESYLTEHSARSARSYVCIAGSTLCEVLPFSFFLPPLCIVLHRPYVRPIDDALATYQRYAILLVDREKAIVCTVHLGKLEKYMTIRGDSVPQKVKHGDDTWDAGDKIFRHIQDHLRRHLKKVALMTESFVREHGIHVLMLGGHKSLFPIIAALLPADIRHTIMGTFASELTIPLEGIVEKSNRIIEGLEEEKERFRLEKSLK